MDLDLGQETVFNVKFRGQSYSINEPTVQQVETFKEHNQIVPFLVSLGLPEDVVKSLPISKVELLVKSITDSITKKK